MARRDWNTAPESEERERPAASQGIGRFLRENGGWVVAIGGLLAMFFGGLNWGTMAMMAVGGIAVAAAKAAGPTEEEARDQAEGIPQGARNRQRSSARSGELEFERMSDTSHSRSNQHELEFALARGAQERESDSTELDVVTPARTPASSQERRTSTELSF